MRHKNCKHIWSTNEIKTRSKQKINFKLEKKIKLITACFFQVWKKNDLGKFKIKLQIDRLEEGLTDYLGHCILTKHRRLLILFA